MSSPTRVPTTLPLPTTTVPVSPAILVYPNAYITTTNSPVILVGPEMIPSTTLPTSNVQAVVGSSTAAAGIFGVGANFDPLIIVALVIAGLLLLLLLGALIYCCCAYCGVPTRQDWKRTSSIRSVRSVGSVRSVRSVQSVPSVRSIRTVRTIRTVRQEPIQQPRPLYLSASFTPECPYNVEEPAASVFLDQPVRVAVGAYAAGDGMSGMATKRVISSYPRQVRQEIVEPEVIVTRRAAPVQMRTVRKKYIYPADVMGYGNDITYNTIRPTVISGSAPMITTLGNGYALGPSIRSSGNRYGRGSLLLYDDDAPSRIVTLN